MVNDYPADWPGIALAVKVEAGWTCVRCTEPHNPRDGYCLTVHHLDGDKSNCRWWNLIAACQRCHLSIQGRVNMRQQYPFEHSEWFKPHAAAWYAFVYHGEQISRQESIDRMDELLSLERRF